MDQIYEKWRTKFSTIALASAIIAVGYSASASADPVTNTVKATITTPTLTTTPVVMLSFKVVVWWKVKINLVLKWYADRT